ncbi:hypothetical protein Zm00014a_004312 [Zea mays]|uniref:Uncharacterized protein n=1 Tax=Zea mays TaxID=4577 RepID=A0A3L6FEK9_MAIZE|nr:hypothetical protein Zm00014a_004312 [Zea mays]
MDAMLRGGGPVMTEYGSCHIWI